MNSLSSPTQQQISLVNQKTGTSFDEADYYANNFNSLGESLVVLFELTMENNWHILVEGYAAVTSKWIWIFFILVHIITIVIIFKYVSLLIPSTE